MGMGQADQATQNMIAASAQKPPLAWDLPEGWTETPGNGMRLVTFHSTDKDPVECTIVSLGGMAGGLESNIVRWMGQINIPMPAQDQFDATRRGYIC